MTASRNFLKWRTLEEPKLVQFVEVFRKWLTTLHSKGILNTGPIIIKKAKSSYDKMKITDKFTFSERWLQNFQEPAAEGDALTSCTAQVYGQ